jgi:integrase
MEVTQLTFSQNPVETEVINVEKDKPKKNPSNPKKVTGAWQKDSKVVSLPKGRAREVLLRSVQKSAFVGIQRALSRANLESYTESAQNMPVSAQRLEGVEMAKHRLRICLGYCEDGTPVVKHISGDSEFNLADRVVTEYVRSGRIDEFIGGAHKPKEVRGVTFKEYTQSWYTTYKEPKLKPTTASGYLSTFEHHLFPAWGSKPINQITTGDIQAFLNERSNLAEKTLKEMLVLIRSIFRSAKEDKLILENPAESTRLTIPSTKKTERKALTQDELTDIIRSLGKLSDDDRRLMSLLIFTGMRRGEVLGLRWEDIDAETGWIHVVRNAVFPGGKNDAVIGTPKTEKGKRSIPLDPVLWELLQPAKATGYVIGGDAPITKMVYVRTMQRIERAIDMHGATALHPKRSRRLSVMRTSALP